MNGEQAFRWLPLGLALGLSACGGGGGGDATNKAPVAAVVAATLNAEAGDTVMLDGSASSDSDGAIAMYQWTQTSGVDMALTSANAAKATFVAPAVAEDTTLEFKLTVQDDQGASASASVKVTIAGNEPPANAPTANAGGDIVTTDLRMVTLDASASSAIEDGQLTFAWTQVDGPSVTLSDANTATPSFRAPRVVAPEAAALTFRVTVTEAGVGSASDDVLVNVTEGVHTLFLGNMDHPYRLKLHVATPDEAPYDLMADDVYAAEHLHDENPSGETEFTVVNYEISPDRHHIYYTVDFDYDDAPDDIYLATLDGAVRQRLSSPDHAGIYMPQWSPDGNRLLFLADYEQGGVESLFVASVDDGIAQAIVGGPTATEGLLGNDGTVAWSLDGSKIAFVGGMADIASWDAFVVAADGGSEPLVLSETLPGARSVSYVDWTANSGGVVFTTDLDHSGVKELYWASPDGAGDPVQISQGGGDLLSAMASNGRTGRFIRYSNAVVPRQNDLYVMTFDAAGAWTGTSKAGGESTLDQQVNQTALSPQGNRWIFTVDASTNNINDLYTVVPGEAPVKVSGVTTQSVASFGFSPDGSRIAFARFVAGGLEIYTASADGTGTPVKVSGAIPANWSWSWSPDGTSIALTVDVENDGTYALYVASADGNSLVKVSSFANDLNVNFFYWANEGLFFEADDAVTGEYLLFGTAADGSTDARRLSGDPETEGDLWWSDPATDGRAAFYLVNRQDVFELYWIGLNDTAPQKVSGPNTADDGDPDNGSEDGDVDDFEPFGLMVQ